MVNAMDPFATDQAASWSEPHHKDTPPEVQYQPGSALDRGLETVKGWTDKVQEQGRIPTMKLMQFALQNRNLRHMG